MVDLYSFTDIAKNSGAPWNMNVSIIKLLNQIEEVFRGYPSHSSLFNLLQTFKIWFPWAKID